MITFISKVADFPVQDLGTESISKMQLKIMLNLDENKNLKSMIKWELELRANND